MAQGDDVAAQLGYRMIERRDVLAVQQPDGAYHPDRRKWTLADIQDHIAGRKTYGHYLVSPEGNARVFCFDLDLSKPNLRSDPPFLPRFVDDDGVIHDYNPREAWLEVDQNGAPHPVKMELAIKLRCMAEVLARTTHRVCGIPTAVAYSGNKGIHVYGFIGSSTPAVEVRAVAQTVLDALGCFTATRGTNFFKHSNPDSGYSVLEIEVYPKQDDLAGKDLGNLLRLPLGINQKSGQRGFFMDLETGYTNKDYGFDADDTMLALTEGSVR